jgi:hypothetical protein
MKTQPSLTSGALLALTSWSGLEVVDWLLIYYPARTQNDGRERTIAWEFHANDQSWHPHECESLEQALQEHSDMVSMPAAEIRRLWGGIVFNKKCDSIGAQNSYLKNLTWHEEGSQFSVKLSGGLMTTSCHIFRVRMVTVALPDCHISE